MSSSHCASVWLITKEDPIGRPTNINSAQILHLCKFWQVESLVYINL